MLSALGIYVGMVLDVLLCLPGAVIAITLHGYTRARCAQAFGDPKPRAEERLTLNPLKQIEPIGLICACVWGMGWCKPASMMLNYFDPAYRRRNCLIVYITPLLVNLLAGLLLGVCAMLLKPLVAPGVMLYVYWAVLGAAGVNVCYALGQCIPVYPMAGERILCQFLKPNSIVKITQYQSIFQVLLMIGMAGGYLGLVIYPICRLILTMAL